MRLQAGACPPPQPGRGPDGSGRWPGRRPGARDAWRPRRGAARRAPGSHARGGCGRVRGGVPASPPASSTRPTRRSASLSSVSTARWKSGSPWPGAPAPGPGAGGPPPHVRRGHTPPKRRGDQGNNSGKLALWQSARPRSSAGMAVWSVSLAEARADQHTRGSTTIRGRDAPSPRPALPRLPPCRAPRRSPPARPDPRRHSHGVVSRRQDIGKAKSAPSTTSPGSNAITRCATSSALLKVPSQAE